tara:strand:- start:4184 stop:4879 length:696 start_codon:yes stop_codon:yes gene_type:complete
MKLDQQLPLRFSYNEQQVFEKFQAANNSELIFRLEQNLREERFSSFWVWGRPGVGVTHILNAICHRFGILGQRVAYLPLREMPADSHLLGGIDSSRLIAIDNIEEWIGIEELEIALMGLYQSVLVHHGKIVFGSNKAAKDLLFALADFQSRCLASSSGLVQPLSDDGKKDLLKNRAKERGLHLDNRVLDYWLNRSPRALADLLCQLELLDEAAMRSKKLITVPFLKSVLKL